MDEKPTTVLSNYDRWQLLNRDCTAPQSYIDWCFYYLIAASLQRRCWMGSEDHRPLYSNIYATLVGPPASGKGVAIAPVNKLLRWHKQQKPGQKNGEISPESMAKESEVELLLASQPDLAAKFMKERRELHEERLLIPLGANATTFESLAETIAASVRRINYMRYDKILTKEVRETYCHCSLAFVLTELSSLFKRQSENIVNLITDMYDCVPYTYKTKTKGTDHIAKGCLNFFAGTTLSYMEEVFSDRIINEGYASRTFFIVESGPRFYRWETSQFTDEQNQAEQELANYVKRLSTVYGEMHFSPEADAYLKHWWEEDMKDGKKANLDPKLEPYYGRKNIHQRKMCMILHASEPSFFSELEGAKCNMEISLATAKKALAVLEKIEKKMHLALTFTASNPLFKPARRAMAIIERTEEKGITWKDLQYEMWEYCDVTTQLKPIIEHLMGVEKVEALENPDESRRAKGLLYRVPIQPMETATKESLPT